MSFGVTVKLQVCMWRTCDWKHAGCKEEELKRRSENEGKPVLRLKTNTGGEMEMSSEHSVWWQISEKAYHVRELLAFVKLGEVPGFARGAA